MWERGGMNRVMGKEDERERQRGVERERVTLMLVSTLTYSWFPWFPYWVLMSVLVNTIILSYYTAH